MKFLAKTLVWLVLLMAVVAAIGRNYLLRAWGERDHFLKQQVMRKLEELFPQAKVELDEVLYDFGHEISLTGFVLRPTADGLPIVNLPKVVIHIDRDALIERQQLDVRKVVIRSPRLNVLRDHNGQWNWQSLLPLPDQGKSSLPEVAIEDGFVTVGVEHAPGVPAGTLAFEHIDIQLVPSGKRQFRVQATSRCDQTGQIEVTGRWHLDQNIGQLDGQFTEITVGQELVGLAASFAPDVRTRLQVFEAKLSEMMQPVTNSANDSQTVTTTATQNAAPLPVVDNGLPQSPPNVGATDSILGLRAKCNVAFRVSRPEPKTTPVFRVRMNIAQGEVSNPLLPFALQNLRGELSVDNDSFRVKKLTAHNGTTRVTIDGELIRADQGFPGQFEIDIANLVCDARLRNRLAGGFGRIYEQHHPTGDLDLHCRLVHDDEGHWRPEGLLATAKDCSIVHDAFAYPIHNVSGTIKQRDRDLLIEARGRAGDREVTLDGTVVDPGPNATLVLDIRASDIPLDETFLKACRPEIQSVLRQMQLTGTMDGHVRLTKAPKQPIVPRVEASLRNGTLNYNLFRYPINRLSGRISSLGTFFQFKDVVGNHGAAKLFATGTFAKLPQHAELNLRVAAENAPIDDSLMQALPASLQRGLKEFSLTGTLGLTTDVHWKTGQPVVVVLPKVELTNASITLRCLPYRLDAVHGDFAYLPGKNGLPELTIQSLTGRHGEMTTTVKGYQRIEPNGDWRAHLDELTIENLLPNEELLASLSKLPGLKDAFASLSQDQPLRMSGVMDLRGTPNPADPITAAWNLDTHFTGSTIHTGLDFKDLFGKVNVRGTWDGEKVDIPVGSVELSSARILDYTLAELRGPFRIQRGELIFGTGDPRIRSLRSIDPREQIRASLFDGNITLDGRATLSKTPEYQVLMNLENCSMERFATLHAPKHRDLRGRANGWVRLDGSGSSANDMRGEGKIQISPAALLTVPVVLQLYSTLSLTPPKESTFNYALFDFNIQNAAFVFKKIYLQGENVSFRGGGRVTFDNDVRLSFISELPKNQIPIPILHEIVVEATKGMVGIEVRGKLDKPKTKVIAAPLLDDTLKGFLRTIPQPLFPLVGQGSKPFGSDKQ